MINKNELPKNWEVSKLSEVVTKKTLKALPSDAPDAKFIGMDCIEPNGLKPAFLYDFKDFKSAGNRFKSGQVLYGRMRPYLNKVYKAEFDGVCSGEFIILECLPIFTPDLLQYILHSRDFVRFVNAKTSGDRPRISYEEISDYPIYLPPLAEQERIVAKIEELFSELDAGRESLKTAARQLKTYRQAVLKWAFEGKLTNENVSEGELPDGWKWKTIKEISSILGDGLHGTPKYSTDGDYFFINGNNLTDGKIEIKENTKRVSKVEFEKHKKNLTDKTVFVSINGTLGNTAFYNNEKVILGKSACYFNVLNEIDKRFIRYCLTTNRFKSYANKEATGSTIKNVGLKAMRGFEVPIPPTPEEQQRIVEEIESRLSVCEKLEETINQSLAQSESLRQSILKQAFEGKLVNSQ
ncbi:MAG: restriction endonuclease subunit S [Acidobacteria bacterium]|jgi:type I restriction enzyme S subunit|nr:restriction endonuclease subunit S [Acidobacteriota bacterium]